MTNSFHNRANTIHATYRGNLVHEVEQYYHLRDDQSSVDRFEEQVRKVPDQIAIKCDDQLLTYAQLNKAANKLAHAILDSGYTSQDTVSLLFEHGLSSIVAIFGALKAGIKYVPLEAGVPQEHLLNIMADSNSRLIVTNTCNLATAQPLSIHGCKILNIDTIDENISSENPGLAISPDQMAAIYYTSGSSGKPKGVPYSQARLHYRPYACYPDDRQSHIFTYSFTASISGILSALLNGISLHLFNPKEKGIKQLIEWLKQEKITIFYPPASLFSQVAEVLTDDDYFPSMYQIELGGQAVYKRDVERFRRSISPECVICVLYASSETGRISRFIVTRDTVINEDVVPVGYPVIGRKVQILDESGEALGVNQVGEIAVQGRFLSEGYWNNPDLTREKFLPDPEEGPERIFLTGDIGSMRLDGILEHHGRVDNMVKIRGYRVEVSAVEASLNNIHAIKEAVVVARKNQSGDQQLMAYVVPATKPPPRAEALRTILAKLYPSYMIPSIYIFLDEFPRTRTGKVDRNALPEPSGKRVDMNEFYAAPRDKLERQLCKIWAKVLDLDLVGVDDNFFDLGGSSIEAMRLFVEIERIAGKELPLAILLKASTVAQQAQILHKEDWVADWSSLVAVQPGGSATPIFCFPGVGGNVLTFHDLARHLGHDQPCYALQSRGLGGEQEPLTRVQEIAEYHIQEMKTVQSNGPYYICGSSFGGMVAYEVAQQLHAQGEEIALLALFDTHAPGYPKRLPGVKRWQKKWHRTLGDIHKHVQNITVGSLKERIEYIHFRIPGIIRRTTRNFINRYQEIRHPLPKNLREVRRANIKATRYQFSPPRFSGRFLLFRASNQPFGIVPDPLMGWGELAGNRIIVHDIKGYHDMLLWEPCVGDVAKLLKEVLTQTTLAN